MDLKIAKPKECYSINIPCSRGKTIEQQPTGKYSILIGILNDILYSTSLWHTLLCKQHLRPVTYSLFVNNVLTSGRLLICKQHFFLIFYQGRFHINEGSYLNCKVSLSKKSFLNYVQQENFFSFVTISPSSHLCLFDQNVVISQSCYALSCRVYSMR